MSLSTASIFDSWYRRHVVMVLAAWRARYPLVRACPPLPADLHMHTVPAETDHARQLRAERAWMQNFIDS